MAPRERSARPSTLDEFATACTDALGFLVRDHGFEACAPKRFGHECSLAYRKPPNLVLLVQCEDHEAPTLVVKARLDARTRRTHVIPLERLARMRIEDWRPPRLDDGPRTAAIATVLAGYADLLATSFGDVLEAADGIGRRLKEGTP